MPEFEVVFNWESAAGDAKNVFHYDFSSSDPGDWEEWINLVAASFSTNCQNRFVPAYTLESITIRAEAAGAIGVAYQGNGLPVSGSATSNEWAAQLALLVRKFHDGGNRPAQGRCYIPGIAAGALDAEGNYEQAIREDVVAWIEDIRSGTLPVGGMDYQMLLKASKPDNPNTLAYTTVDRVGAPGNPTTQKRRRRGVGS